MISNVPGLKYHMYENCDISIISDLKSEGRKRERATLHLIQTNIYLIPSFCSKFNISEASALDEYTDAIVELSLQVIKGQFFNKAKLTTYFYRIFRNKCIDLAKSKKSIKIDFYENIDQFEQWSATKQRNIPSSDELEHLHICLEQMDPISKQIIMDWGYWGYNMKEIAARTGLATAKHAKDRKYKALLKLRKIMDAQAVFS